jgi:PAS domain S-box-containing protein
MDAPTGSDSNLDKPTLGLVQEGIASALSLAGVGVWEYLLPEGRFSCSDGFYQLLGVEPAAARLVSDFWPDRIHPQDRQRCLSAYSDFLEERAPAYEQGYRVRHEQGHWVSVLSRAHWVTRTDGKAGRCVLGYVIDYTARSADVDQLRAREERFRMSVSALQGVVYDHDLRTHRSERHGLQSMLGYEDLRSDDGHDGWSAIIHPDDLAQFTATIEAGRVSGAPYEMIYRVRHRDGRWRHVRQRGTYMREPDGKPVRAFGVVEDITDAEAQREQLRMQAAIIERLSEGVMLASREGIILFANPALERMFGYGRSELEGKHAQMLSFRGSEEFEGLVRTVLQSTDNDRTSVIDVEGRRRDNSMAPLQGYFSALTIGTNRCVVAVFTDISEQKQLERQMMQVATRVQQRIGGDLHDGLGQQLTGIAMMLQGLGQRAGRLGAPALRSEVEEITGLVNAAISSTRSLARGLSPVRPTRDGLVEGFEELVNQVFERYRIQVSLDLQLPESLPLDEDAASNLYRIAQEGVLNAARHSDAEHIRLRLRVAGTDVELLVSDDGRGFDPLHLARGGMGLRIMRFRAQLLGGYLSVESRPGAGTTLRCRCQVNASREVA